MPTYRYKAMEGSGRTVDGTIVADTPDQAGERLIAKGQTPVSIRPVRGASRANPALRLGGKGKVRDEELILFTTQLATMLRAGVPILRAVEILESEAENRRMKDVCNAMATDIRGGMPLNAALRRHPDVFPPLYRNMVSAGEASGNLPQVLQRLIYVISHEHKVRTEIRSVLQYPIMVVVVLVGAMAILLTTVVPRFAEIFRNAKLDLPLPTTICIAMSDFLRNQWPWLMGGLILAGIAIFVLRRTPAGLYWMSRGALGIPYLGTVLIKASLSRFAGIFSILQASGVGMIEAIDILSGTLGNQAMTREFDKVKRQVEHGHGLSRPLASARYFTPMFVSMVAIGEETGKLDEMLREISSHYDTEVEFAAKRLTGAIGPILIVTLAAVVGFFALAVYMPMWDIAKIATRSGG